MNRVLNVFALLLMLTLNGLANGLPLNGYTTGELSAFYPNLFVPAGLTFAVWGFIYLLVIVFVASAWFAPPGSPSAGDTALSWPFIVSCIANAAWIVAWHFRLVFLSVFIILVLFASLLMLYQRIRRGPWRWYLAVPISVYLGWVSVATIANITAMLVYHFAPFTFPTEVASATTMVVIAALLAGYLLWSKHDSPLALVVAWALLGIWLRTGNDTSMVVRNTALAASVVLVIGSAANAFVRKAGHGHPVP